MGEGITATETAAALVEIKEIVETSGINIELVPASPTSTKDALGKVVGPPSNDIRKAYPVRFSPFDRRISQTLAYPQEAEIVIYVSKKKADEDGKTFDFFQTIQRMIYLGKEYELLSAQPHMQVGVDYLYYRIEGRKKQTS